MAMGVYAEKLKEENRVNVLRVVTTLFLLGSLLLSTGSVVVLNAATQQDLQDQIAILKDAVHRDALQTTDVLNALNVLGAPAQSLSMGIVSGVIGTTVNLPVYFKEGARQVSALQFDVNVSSGLSVASVNPGLAAQASGKGVQGNLTPSGFRVLVFGLNQTPIPSGPIGVLRVNIGSAGLGKRNIQILNISASDPSGVVVPLAGKNGSLEVR